MRIKIIFDSLTLDTQDLKSDIIEHLKEYDTILRGDESDEELVALLNENDLDEFFATYYADQDSPVVIQAELDNE